MINALLIFLIQGLRPMLGPAECKFAISCTPYAIEQLKNQRVDKAISLIIKRLLSCNPFHTPHHE